MKCKEMQGNETRRVCSRAVSLLLVAMMMLCFGACPVSAEASKSVMPVMYKADSAGIISSWEGSEGKSSGSEWSNWGFIQESYNEKQQTEHINIEYSGDENFNKNLRTIILTFTPGLSTSGAKKLAIGARASCDFSFNMYYWGSNIGANEDNKASFGIGKSDYFREYIIDISNVAQLDDLTNLRMDVAESKHNNTNQSIDIAYVRLVDDTYGTSQQSPINSGAVEYNPADNIVDFDFGEDLDESSVNSSKITINGAPVRWVMTLPTKPSRLRVSLGELKKSRTYMASFSGLMTKEGVEITNSDFTFSTTMLEAVNSDITLHKAAKPVGIVKSWEGTDIESSEVSSEGNGSDTNTMKAGSDSHTVKWEDWGLATETWMAESDAERAMIWPNQTANILSYYTDKWEWGDATKLAVGIRSSANFSVQLFAGASDSALYSWESCDFTTEDNNVFKEYVFNKSDFKNSTWNDQTQFGYLRLVVTNPEDTAQSMDIAYVRLVDDTYNGPLGTEGANITPEEFSDTYDAKINNVFDLVFDRDIDLSNVPNENFTFNRSAADYVMVDPANPKRIRVSMKMSMTSLSRATLKVSGLYTADGAPINEKAFRFTTAAADVHTGELPVISTFDLVTDYKSSNEAPVMPDVDLSGKTVTAVAGGLYNNTEEPKSYTLMLACYDENDTLVDVAMQTYHLCSYESLSETGTSSGTGTGATKVDLTVPSNGKHTVRAFAWDEDTLIPLCNAVSPVDGQEPINLLIMGNSITYHGAAPSIGWLGNWGMAATSAEQDYSHLLAAKARTLVPVNLKIHGIGDFERYFYDFSQIEGSAHKDAISFEPDIIICTIGANIKQTHLEDEDGNQTDEVFDKSHYKNIIDYFNPSGKAKIIVGNTIFTSEDAKAQIKAYAEENGAPYVEMGDLTADEYLGTAHQDAPCFAENVTNGVLIHPGNKGMAVMADRLWVPLQAAIEECLENR
ncbi:SGNH/GDSL hydrolase family protein [Lachnospiraceae bacterium MD329]|nr:SGNH/GDSL hydrolase family protein [Lachnospiraceae bacterium MD329]